MTTRIEKINLLKEIAPENLTPDVITTLGFIGNIVTKTFEKNSHGEYTVINLPGRIGKVLIGGDYNCWGAVVGARVDEGHLILIVNFDFGLCGVVSRTLEYSFTSDKVNKILPINIGIINTFDELKVMEDT